MENHYIESGTGFPLLLLHGNGENLHYFDHQIPAFAPYYRVIAVDTRGHGDSPRGTAPFTIAQFAEDLRNLLDRLRIRQAHLLGFSDGGNIALAFALRHPERIASLILNGANLNPGGIRSSTQLPIVLGWRIAGLFKSRSPEARKHWELLNLMVAEPKLSPEDLACLPMRTLVIAGTRDMVKRTHTEAIARAIPNAELRILPGDHFLANKSPERFNQAVLAFLAGGAGTDPHV